MVFSQPGTPGSSLALCSALALLASACERPAPENEASRPRSVGAARQAESKDDERDPTLAVVELRCEHADAPLALDTRAPRFSWKLAALDPARRGLAQSAQRILVASSAAALAEERGDLWDSGRVAARETVDVVYAGRALRSFEPGYWRVQVWDQDGVGSAWSAPAHFGMGVLEAQDWQAQWIGFDAPLRDARPIPDLGEAHWIRAAGGEREIWLRRRFELAGPVDARAVLVVAAADELELFLNAQSVLRGSSTPGVRRNAEIVRVARALVSGTNVLAARVRTQGETPAALSCRVLLNPEPTAPGAPVEIRTDESWRVSAGATTGWEQVSFDDSAWQNATVLGAQDDAWLPEVDPPAAFLPPPRLLRTAFQARAQPVRATLFASALGVYSLELNGARAHDDWLAPGWTDYTRRIPYRGYDVTALVRAGENALGVVLADGWYAGLLGQRGQRNHYGDAARFLAQLVLDYADGTREIVASDASWRAAVGPWREADLYLGERYDARLELAGWSAPGFDAAAWQPVDVGASVAAPLVSHPGPEIRVVAELEPVATLARGPGRVLFDFGQNFAGVARLALEAPAGTALVLRFAEALEADGSLMRRNLTWARAVDQYTCKGGGGSEDDTETWQPRFTYHGFRYAEVAGLPAGAKALLTGLALSSATQLAGDFRCSDPLVNKLVENARWTLRANSMDLPTDCPQRGERLGWTGDAQLFARSAFWLADLQTLYDKWSLDLLDAQRPDGRFPATAPSFPGMPDGGPAWSDAGVLVPALLHEFYGDTRLVERQLESMKRFLACTEKESGPECKPPADIAGYGDWQNHGAVTPKEVLYLAYFARSARRLAELSLALGGARGSAAEAERHDALVARIRAAFARLCVDREGRVTGETQTAYALALREDLVPPERRAASAAFLLADIERRGTRLSTGFVGTPELLPALTSLGRSDVAYRLLRSRELPSWGYMVEQGATTLWERWDAWTSENGFASNGRPSLDHTPLGSVVAWLFESAAGIRPAEPGFRCIEFAPVPGGGLEWAEATYDSVRGRMALRWELAGDGLRLEVTVPANVRSTLSLPTRAPGSVLENGHAPSGAAGVRVLDQGPGGVLLVLDPGRYTFTCSDPILAR